MIKRLYLCGAAAAAGLASVAVMLCAAAPGGDLKKQQPKYHIDVIPPAPVLTPEQEQKTFKLPAGFRIELVAAEPMVQEPVVMQFDPDGRLYVVEMRGYMPTLAADTEFDPSGRVSRLESTKGDGTFDKATVVLDKLVMPRSIGLAGDGFLLSEPPNVWFCKDPKGTGEFEKGKAVFTDFAALKPADPEHKANGLTWTLDNWYYNANWGFRFRFDKGQFLRDGTVSRGQWGIATDDIGRIYYNSNSSMLRVDEAPAASLTKNPYISSPAGVNVGIASNAIFSARVNPGVNRGYTADCDLTGHLQRVTAACGATVYRGDAFPADFLGNAFVCEPAGNLVSRQVISQDGVALKAKGALHNGLDFLTSTDERFRPVSAYNGPDGALYIIDMYHGIIQHKAYISAYLEDQVKRRNLDKNDGDRGRIWRIVPDNFKQPAWPKLASASSADLVKTLSHPNGWWRDTAQRLLVERNDSKMAKPLYKIAGGKDPEATPLGKLHALRVLQGMDALDDEVNAAAAADADWRVRLTALQVSEVSIHKHIFPRTQKALVAAAKDPSSAVQLEVLMMGTPDLPDVAAVASGILAQHINDPVFRCAALNAAVGRELDLLTTLLTSPAFTDEALSKIPIIEEPVVLEKWEAQEKAENAANTPAAPAKPPAPKAKTPPKTELFHELATCVIRSRSADRIEGMLDLIAQQPPQTKAVETILTGAADALVPNAKSKVPARRLRLTRQPPAMLKLLASPNKKVVELATKVEAVMSWPGKPGDTTPPLKPLTSDQEKRFVGGREVFTQICAQCHQPSGLGQDGIAPPLVDSEWVLGPQNRVVRIALNGVHGPIKIGKKTVDMEMPGLKALDDVQISSVLTYIRREWGHEANPVEPETVGAIRKETDERGDLQWTADELMEIK